MTGDPDGNMRPDDNATRAEIAVVANRLYDLTRERFEDLVASIDQAVVMVVNEGTKTLEDGRKVPIVDATGSGVSIGGGLVVTNAHVVLNADGTKDALYGILWHSWGFGEGNRIRYAMAELVFLATDVDLALLRVGIAERGDMPVLPLGDQAQIARGQPVAAFGSPVGLIGTVTTGVVSYAGRTISYYLPDGRLVTIPDMIQTDAPINPGNSGGALVNLRGELIGIPSVKLAHLAYEGLAFAIGIQTVRAAVDVAGIRLAPKPEMYRPDYESLGWYVTAAKHTRPGAVRWLVVHHEGSPTPDGSDALGIHRWYMTRPDDEYAGIGYHAVVEQDGRLAEGRPLWAVGAHAARKGGPNYNPESLALCFSGNLNMRPPTPAQWAAGVALLRWWQLLWPEAVIKGHGELPELSTDCPGRYLDMNLLRQTVWGGR